MSVLAFHFFSLQYTFQVILLTDGRTSFAVFIYSSLMISVYHMIGFYAEDRISSIQSDSLDTVNIFRIDGIVCALELYSKGTVVVSFIHLAWGGSLY